MSKKITFAICGLGHVACRWLDVFVNNNDAELIAVADPDPSAFNKLQDYNFSGILTFNTIEQVYENCKPDATIVLTPPQYHARYIQEAIEANTHVISEKPVCTTLNQLYNLIEVNKDSKKKGLQFVINQQYRWNPRITAIRDIVQQKLLGDIFLVNSKFNQNDYHFNTWWRKQTKYISLFNWYIHHIDSMRFYLDQKPISVRAKFIRPPHSKIFGYSSMILNVKFEKGTEWLYLANQEGRFAYEDSGHTTFTMYGTKGTLINTKNTSPIIYTEQTGDSGKEIGENISDIDNEFTYPPGWSETMGKFIHSIKTGEPHPTSFDDNLWTIGILFAAIESFEQNKEVNVKDIISKNR
ncbi:MAG: Gfo/Idh/MocA family protein [Promethearchaeota archaeon]